MTNTIQSEENVEQIRHLCAKAKGYFQPMIWQKKSFFSFGRLTFSLFVWIVYFSLNIRYTLYLLLQSEQKSTQHSIRSFIESLFLFDIEKINIYCRQPSLYTEPDLKGCNFCLIFLQTKYKKNICDSVLLI